MPSNTVASSQVTRITNKPTTDTASNETISRPCYLLALPAELRNYIYEFVACEFLDMEVKTYEENTADLHLELTQICRQIRHEVHAVLYQHNIFRFTSSGYHTLTEELHFGPLEYYIPKLCRIEIANRFHSSYFTLGIDDENPLKWSLEVVEVPDCEMCGPGSIVQCFANNVSLAAGRKYLEGVAKRAGGGRLLDADTLENLILKLEFPLKGKGHVHNAYCRCAWKYPDARRGW